MIDGKKRIIIYHFLIHQLAEEWDKTPSEVYSILKSANVIEDYIVPCYDTLHTLGRRYFRIGRGEGNWYK